MWHADQPVIAKPSKLRCLMALLAIVCTGGGAENLPFVNWENHPVHGLDLSPDGTTLAIAHTADQRVQLVDISTGEAIVTGHVVVGIDPVSVRFRNDNELWVVNHISDSVSIVDVDRRRVMATLQTLDEPADVVFAGSPQRAFVSCSQANALQVFDPLNSGAPPLIVPIAAEDPRALAVSPDGLTVYAAIFESGNGSTVLAGGLINDAAALPNVVSDPRGPYGGQNPPPNAGAGFEPPIRQGLPTPPAVGLIVKRDAQGRWLDDNDGDWSEFVSGSLAGASGRPANWTLPDRDVAIIDAASLAVDYISGLMNIGMAMGVNPVSGNLSLVGTDAINEVRYEPTLNGRFLRVNLALIGAGDDVSIVDLNPHLDYSSHQVAQALRSQSIGDPRAIVWQANGQRAWVAGLGSNNLIRIDPAGARIGEPIRVGQGPVALALDEGNDRIYVWNHFEASLSVINTETGLEEQREALFNPLPEAIVNGRPLFYDTHRTSGTGHLSCAACHVDSRMDRLAWDLGDPAGQMQAFDQNCVTTVGLPPCEDFHPMKGPMTTQTMQDIIHNEPFHWRGDRAGIEAFNPAFVGLLGDDVELTDGEMQAFEDFLDTLTFPPNPFRGLDNSLPTALSLDGHYTSGRFAMPGLPLGTGDAQRGLELFSRDLLDGVFQCASCHTLPSGMAVNGPLFLGNITASAGGSMMALGPLGENHLGIVTIDGSTNVSIKVPQLRNQYEKVGFDLTQTENLAGFGFLHDGSVDSLSRFISASTFSVDSDQDVADLVAFSLAFSGSGFLPEDNPIISTDPPPSQDTHAGVGAQVTDTGDSQLQVNDMVALARGQLIDLVLHGDAGNAWRFDSETDALLPADGSSAVSVQSLLDQASPTNPLTWTLVPNGLASRLGIDRDGDGIGDRVEIEQGSDPADAASTTLRPTVGLWFNPQRSGHGFDLQFLAENMFVTWYTYNDDGTPTWYQAAAPFANPWQGELNRFTWNPETGFVDIESVGQLVLEFSDAGHSRFDWTLGERNGSEMVQLLATSEQPALPDRTGTWYDPNEPGWGFSLYTQGALRVSVLYFYDGDNQPRWVLGQGQNSTAESLPMLSFSGFCPDCPAFDVSSMGGGSITVGFDGARRGSVSTEAFFVGQPESPWLREDVAIVPLSDPPLNPSAR